MAPGRVTVVVMTRNRREALLETLPRHEAPVLVVDNGSTDGTAEALAAARLPHVELVRLGRNHGAAARNLGVALAETPYVAFADDDSWWEPGSLCRAAGVFDRHPAVAVAAARILVGEGCREDPICAVMADSPLPSRPGLPGPQILGFVACAAVVRRDAFLSAGGFDRVVFFGGEEERLSIDLACQGWVQCYVPELVARHHPSPQRSTDCVRRRLISRNAVLTAVMRRPWSSVAGLAYRTARRDRCSLLGVLTTVPRLPAALRHRDPITPTLESHLRSLS
jgi:GT2 family glycosyltransferase